MRICFSHKGQEIQERQENLFLATKNRRDRRGRRAGF